MSDKQSKKVDVYECAFFEYEYDDLGKYSWCHCKKMPSRECDCHFIYAQQFCPCFDKGKMRGSWIPTEDEIRCAEKFKEQKTSMYEANKQKLN